jgi:hypothetical protein
MIDKPGIVSTPRCVNSSIVVYGEQKRMVPFHLVVVVTPVLFLAPNPFAGVLDDPSARLYSSGSESAFPLYP